MSAVTDELSISIRQLGKSAFEAGATVMKAAIMKQLVAANMHAAARAISEVEVVAPQAPEKLS